MKKAGGQTQVEFTEVHLLLDITTIQIIWLLPPGKIKPL